MPTVASGGCCFGVLWRLFLLAYVVPFGAFGDCLDIEHSSTFFDNVVWGPTNEDVRATATNSGGMTTPMVHDLDSGLLHSAGQPFILILGNASLLDILSFDKCLCYEYRLWDLLLNVFSRGSTPPEAPWARRIRSGRVISSSGRHGGSF